jgi:ABC-type multidrug transport system fused ATPase/permease subunit
MTFTTSVYWACRFWTSLELDLKYVDSTIFVFLTYPFLDSSVERIVEYLDLPQEPLAVIESHRPPAYWPSSPNNGALVEVEDLVIKYAPELPPVLHGVSFTLKTRERVGLLGRTGTCPSTEYDAVFMSLTGSGKSTLAMSLLRFVSHDLRNIGMS